MKQNILEVKSIKKSYGTKLAVNDVSFVVRKGSLFAFLGQNGAGKSTTINMITTLLSKDSGTIILNGNADEAYIRSKIGVVFQENVLDDLLTVKENLLLRGSFYINGKKAILERYNELLNKLNLHEFENQRFKSLSGGQKRRVEIARALFSNPELLILDEPTTGLDPETRQIVWDVIGKLRTEDGITVFLTTHYMEEVANSDYVIIMHKGEILESGTPAELKEKHAKDYFKVVPKSKEKLIEFLMNSGSKYRRIADQFHIEVGDSAEAMELMTKLKDNIDIFEVTKGTLDDVFINVIGRKDASNI